MQTKFEKLTKEFELLKMKIEESPSISCISSKQLLKYHSLISRKELLESKISKILKSKKQIIQNYSQKNEIWLHDNNLNCRQYCKLEEQEAYKRDKKLYKLGLLNSKPNHPIVKKFKEFFSTNVFEPISDEILPKINSYSQSVIKKSPICKMFNKIKKFNKEVLPVKLTNLAIAGTKKCIIGYRTLANNINYSSSTISSKISCLPAVQVISYVGTQAKQQADMHATSFRERIKVNTNGYINSNNNIYMSTNPYNQNLRDYDLSL